MELFRQVSTALGLAHQKGIVHRDIKPANLFIERLITSTGEVETVKLVDFGVAGMAENDGDNRDQRLTSVGAVFGSPLYMSPEQILGNSVSSAADIYSCGCALFEALTRADKTDIRDDDLKVIATIDSLEALSLSANKRVTAAGLSALAVLPRLRALEIGELTVPAEDLIVVLKKFKRLDSLTVGNGDWTTTEIQPFEKSLNIRVIKHPIARVIVRATEVPEVLHSLGGKK